MEVYVKPNYQNNKITNNHANTKEEKHVLWS